MKATGGAGWESGLWISHHRCVLLVLFFVPGRIPREPRLNPTSGLPIDITAQISPTCIGRGYLNQRSLFLSCVVLKCTFGPLFLSSEV